MFWLDFWQGAQELSCRHQRSELMFFPPFQIDKVLGSVWDVVSYWSKVSIPSVSGELIDMVQLRLITKEDEMSNTSKTFYRDMRKKAHEFESREEFLNHDLKIMSFPFYKVLNQTGEPL